LRGMRPMGTLIRWRVFDSRPSQRELASLPTGRRCSLTCMRRRRRSLLRGHGIASTPRQLLCP